MSITKAISSILLAALSKQQYRQLMQDTKDSADKSFSGIIKNRNTKTHRKIFGNKQRVWIKLDTLYTDKEQLKSEYLNSNELKNGSGADSLKKIKECIKDVIYGYYALKNDIDTAEDIANQYVDRFSNDMLIDMYVNGYIISPITNRRDKLGKFQQKILDQLTKKDNKEFSEIIDKIKQEHKEFNLRKEKTKDGNRIIREDILMLWDESTGIDWYACITRSPQDIGAISTGQGWTSCQNLDKDESGNIEYDSLNWHIKYDIALGTCAAYLMSSAAIARSKEEFRYDTKNFPLLNPTARISIKPFYSTDGELYLSIGTDPVTYGGSVYLSNFVVTVNSYLEKKQADINGKFTMPNALYNESIGNRDTIIVKNGIIVKTSGKNNTYSDEAEYLLNNYTEDELARRITVNNWSSQVSIKILSAIKNKLREGTSGIHHLYSVFNAPLQYNDSDFIKKLLSLDESHREYYVDTGFDMLAYCDDSTVLKYIEDLTKIYLNANSIATNSDVVLFNLIATEMVIKRRLFNKYDIDDCLYYNVILPYINVMSTDPDSIIYTDADIVFDIARWMLKNKNIDGNVYEKFVKGINRNNINNENVLIVMRRLIRNLPSLSDETAEYLRNEFEYLLGDDGQYNFKQDGSIIVNRFLNTYLTNK